MQIHRHNIQKIALYLYFFSLNFEVFLLGGFGTTARVTGLLYCLTMLPDLLKKTSGRRIRAFMYPVIIFWIYLTLISLANINRTSSDFLDRSVMLNILLFWVLMKHELSEPGVILKGMLGFAFGAVLLAFFYYLGIGIEITGGRISIFGDNVNAVGIRLSMAILVLLYAVVKNDFLLKKWRLVFLLPIPTMLNLMLNTGSRKAFIGFALAFLFGGLLLPMKRLSYKVTLLIIAAGMSLYILQLFNRSEVMVKRFQQTTEQGDLAGRDKIWRTIWPLIKSNPILGVGKTGYAKFAKAKFGGDQVRSPHNVFIEVMAYTGIIGLTLYLTFWWRISIQAFRTYRYNGYLLPLLLLIPVSGMMLGGQALELKIVWAICAMTASTVFYNRHPIPHQSDLSLSHKTTQKFQQVPHALLERLPPATLDHLRDNTNL